MEFVRKSVEKKRLTLMHFNQKRVYLIPPSDRSVKTANFANQPGTLFICKLKNMIDVGKFIDFFPKYTKSRFGEKCPLPMFVYSKRIYIVFGMFCKLFAMDFDIWSCNSKPFAYFVPRYWHVWVSSIIHHLCCSIIRNPFESAYCSFVTMHR